jgi:hypothetical protein
LERTRSVVQIGLRRTATLPGSADTFPAQRAPQSPVALKDCGVVNIFIFAVRGKNAVHAAENSRFPIDESAVAIEGENFESAEVEHGARHLRGEFKT